MHASLTARQVPYTPVSIGFELFAVVAGVTWFAIFFVGKFAAVFSDFGPSLHPFTIFVVRLSDLLRSPFWLFGGAWFVPIAGWRACDWWNDRAKSKAIARLSFQFAFWLIAYGFLILIGVMVAGCVMNQGGLQDVVK